MRYTSLVLVQRFFPVLLLVAEFVALYAMTAVVSAFVPAPAAVSPVEYTTATTTPREVRLVVVSSQSLEVEPLAERAVALPVNQRTEVSSAAEVSEMVQEKGVAPKVPFYSQFTDITSPQWQKVGCGIASLAMLIDYYTDESVSVDALLARGLAAGAYLDDAGWIHAGLIALAQKYQLDGESVSGFPSMDRAFAALVAELERGPVIASVHYTFEPTNPIPHLVIITGVRDGRVFYNDPAETTGGHSLSEAKFKRAWKQRYITIRPVSR